MKILFTFYNPSGGMETLNRIRCKLLQKHGIDCQMLYKLNGSGIQNVRDSKVHITNDPKEIAYIIQVEQFDAIIINSDAELMEYVRLTGFNKPIFYEVQGLGTYKTAEAVIQASKTQVEQYATGVLYPKTSHLIKLMRAYFPGKAQFVYNNPLDIDNFGYTDYSIQTSPIIGWIGRLEKNKNWSDFVELSHRLIQRCPSLYLWMFGDPDLYDPVEQLHFQTQIRKYHLEQRLIHHANVPHELMADYLSIIGDSGGFLCSTSLVEGFGYAVAEALLCRCPVLSTKSDGVNNFITHAKTGMYYSVGNIDDALQQAKQVMYNSALRQQIREQGEYHMKENFAPEEFVRHFKEMLAAVGL
jgi:L-malate glycosyltransferase